jgi:hypothetical protein
LITPDADVRERWKGTDLSTKREVARLLFSPDLLGELWITRAQLTQQGVWPPVQERVVFRKAA